MHRPCQQGFALLYVLGMLALLAIVITGLSRQYQEQLDLVSYFKGVALEELEHEALFAKLVYQLAGSNYEPNGFSNSQVVSAGWPTRFYSDNRAMAVDGYTVRIQDSGGLISLNYGFSRSVKRLLSLRQVSTQQQNQIVAQWEDYLDSDSKVRSNGLESSSAYWVRNGDATNISEFLNLPGVAALPPEHVSWLAARLTIDIPPGISLHSASAEVIYARQGVGLESAQAFVEALRKDPAATPGDLFGGSWAEDEFAGMSQPAPMLRLCVLRHSYPSWTCRVYDFTPFDYRAGVEFIEQYQLPTDSFD